MDFGGDTKTHSWNNNIKVSWAKLRFFYELSEFRKHIKGFFIIANQFDVDLT